LINWRIFFEITDVVLLLWRKILLLHSCQCIHHVAATRRSQPGRSLIVTWCFLQSVHSSVIDSGRSPNFNLEAKDCKICLEKGQFSRRWSPFSSCISHRVQHSGKFHPRFFKLSAVRSLYFSANQTKKRTFNGAQVPQTAL
jgi:hypothetical protein